MLIAQTIISEVRLHPGKFPTDNTSLHGFPFARITTSRAVASKALRPGRTQTVLPPLFVCQLKASQEIRVQPGHSTAVCAPASLLRKQIPLRITNLPGSSITCGKTRYHITTGGPAITNKLKETAHCET